MSIVTPSKCFLGVGYHNLLMRILDVRHEKIKKIAEEKKPHKRYQSNKTLKNK